MFLFWQVLPMRCFQSISFCQKKEESDKRKASFSYRDVVFLFSEMWVCFFSNCITVSYVTFSVHHWTVKQRMKIWQIHWTLRWNSRIHKLNLNIKSKIRNQKIDFKLKINLYPKYLKISLSQRTQKKKICIPKPRCKIHFWFFLIFEPTLKT